MLLRGLFVSSLLVISIGCQSKLPNKNVFVIEEPVEYGLHSRAWADSFIKKCKGRVKTAIWCDEIVVPNIHSKRSFYSVYNKSKEHLLVPRKDKFEVGIRLLEILERAVGGNSEMRVCQIANWYRPEPYNSRVGGAKRSAHIAADAIDIKFCTRAGRNRAKKRLIQLEKIYKTLGIGSYKGSHSVTIHLDFKTRNYEI